MLVCSWWSNIANRVFGCLRWFVIIFELEITKGWPHLGILYKQFGMLG